MENKSEQLNGQPSELTPETVIGIMKAWSLPMEPRTEEGWKSMAKAFIKIVGTEEKALWLSERILDGCDRFPMPIEMRRIFAKRFKPADGKEPSDVDNYDLMNNTLRG